jgi:hypothetical protein
MYSHPCLKCSKVYQDEDPEAYYCAPCNEERKAIAATVDARRATIPSKKRMSGIQEYDASPKVRGFVRVSL